MTTWTKMNMLAEKKYGKSKAVAMANRAFHKGRMMGKTMKQSESYALTVMSKKVGLKHKAHHRVRRQRGLFDF